MGQVNCWEQHHCTLNDICPAYPDHGSDCWNIDGTLCSGKPKPSRSEDCLLCESYQEAHGETFDRTPYKTT